MTPGVVLRPLCLVLSLAISQAFLRPARLAGHGLTGNGHQTRAARASYRGFVPRGITMQAEAQAKRESVGFELSPQDLAMVANFRENLPPPPSFGAHDKARAPVAIVDPILKHYSLGELARQRGVRVVCVLSASPERGGRYMLMRRGEEVYEGVVTVREGAEGIAQAAEELRALGVSHCLVGCQTGVKCCNELNQALGSKMANEPEGARTQHDKNAVNARLRDCGLGHIDEILTGDAAEALAWSERLFQKGRRVVVKPAGSMGSLGVRLCGSADEVQKAFDDLAKWARVASMSLFMEGGLEKAIVQECLEGRKFGVQTVSASSKHYTTSVFGSIVWRGKTPGDEGGGCPVTKAWYVISGDASAPSKEPLAVSREELHALVRANNKALDAMGVRNGACHNEIMLNHKGEFCLVDPNVRPVGNGLVDLERLAVGPDMDQFSIFGDLCSTPEKVTELALAQEQILMPDSDEFVRTRPLYPTRNALAARISVTPEYFNRTYEAPTQAHAQERLPTLVAGEYFPYPVTLNGVSIPRYGAAGLAFPGRMTLAGEDADVLRDWGALDEWMEKEGEGGFYRFEGEDGDAKRIEWMGKHSLFCDDFKFV